MTSTYSSTEHLKSSNSEDLAKLREELKNSPLDTHTRPFKTFDKSRGFHHADVHKAAEELRMSDKGSHDPCYENSKKNK